MTTALDRPALEAPRTIRLPRRLPRFGVPGWMRHAGWRTVAGALLLAGVIHICTVLAVPLLGPGNAFLKLRAALPANRAVLLTSPAPGKQLLPLMVPDAFYVFCRYDISVDSLRVTTPLSEAGWTLSLHTPQGDNYYVMPAQQRRADVSFVVVPGAERASEIAPSRRLGSPDTQVASPTLEGVVMVRAPLKGLAWRSQTEDALARVSCSPVKR
jgi:uncharacterized membrane protein